MKIIKVLDDGSYVTQYEKGDWVKILNYETWQMKPGDIVRVVDADDYGENAVNWIYVEVIGWGEATIPAKDVEPAKLTKAQLPEIIQAWNEAQIRNLITGVQP